MIERTTENPNHNYQVTCSKCQTKADFVGMAFAELVKHIQSIGWNVTKWGAVWFHHCPACMLATKKAEKSD